MAAKNPAAPPPTMTMRRRFMLLLLLSEKPAWTGRIHVAARKLKFSQDNLQTGGDVLVW
jgi:hypothetical protein